MCSPGPPSASSHAEIHDIYALDPLVGRIQSLARRSTGIERSAQRRTCRGTTWDRGDAGHSRGADLQPQ